MIDFRVRTFLTVCQTMNYTRAAELLNITQPNASQHIRWLEEEYGEALLVYRGRQLALTEAGELLRKTAMAMLHEDELLRRQMAAERKRRKIFFGVTKSVSQGQMHERLLHFLERRRDCDVRFLVDNTHKLSEAINQKELDFAIVEGNFDRALYDSAVVNRSDFVLVCGAQDPLGRQQESLPMLMEELRKKTLLVRERGSGTREIQEHLLESNNMAIEDFASYMEISDIGMIKDLLREGLGVSFLYEDVVRKELGEGTIAKIHMDRLELSHDYSLIWLKTEMFGEYYRQIAAELSGE